MSTIRIPFALLLAASLVLFAATVTHGLDRRASDARYAMLADFTLSLLP
jgi:hypothetical protein